MSAGQTLFHVTAMESMRAKLRKSEHKRFLLAAREKIGNNLLNIAMWTKKQKIQGIMLMLLEQQQQQKKNTAT